MVLSYPFRIHRNLGLKICIWEDGFLSCNVHDSSIYLNTIFGKRVHLMSFHLNMQLFPKKIKGNYTLFFSIFFNDVSLVIFVQM